MSLDIPLTQSKKVKILCIEDNSFDYKIFETKLLKNRDDKYDVSWVDSFDAAIKILVDTVFDICFVDYSLDEKTGLDIIDFMKERGIDTPCIMLTSFDDENFVQGSLQRGLYDYILKSEVTPSLLDRTILYALERKKIEDALKKDKHRYKLESIGQMAGGMAHELNNLLQPIMMKAEDIYDETNSDEHKDSADKILECAQNAAKIISDVLSFSHRSDNGLAIVDFRKMCAEQIKFAAEMTPKAIQIHTHGFEDGEDEVIYAAVDVGDLFRVFSNLFTNAAQAMEYSGDIYITLSVEAAQLTLRVEDTGPGIPKDKQENIFDPFFTTKETGQGTGLGLSIIHGILESWGSTITLGDGEYGGACFVMHIPVVAAENLPKSPESSALQAAQ